MTTLQALFLYWVLAGFTTVFLAIEADPFKRPPSGATTWSAVLFGGVVLPAAILAKIIGRVLR